MVTLNDVLAISGLTLGVLSCIFTAFFIGAVCLMEQQLKDAKTAFIENIKEFKEELKDSKTALSDKVNEFSEVTAKASEANNSMGTMLSDMGEKLHIMDERVSMLSGTPTGGKSWQPQATRTNT